MVPRVADLSRNTATVPAGWQSARTVHMLSDYRGSAMQGDERLGVGAKSLEETRRNRPPTIR